MFIRLFFCTRFEKYTAYTTQRLFKKGLPQGHLEHGQNGQIHLPHV